MTTQKLFKRRVRERMSKTGERYTAARSHMAGKQDGRTDERQIDLGPALELASDEKVTAATGRGWAQWLAVLDGWGARDRRHGEIAAYLSREHDVPGWWTQSITNGYERTRGMRQKHQQADGYTIYASKTVAVPLARLFEAFTDPRIRRRWLTDGSMTARNAQPGKVARFAWEGGPTRIEVTFEAKGEAKATAYVAHSRLPDAEAGESAKSAWKARLSVLKSALESRR